MKFKSLKDLEELENFGYKVIKFSTYEKPYHRILCNKHTRKYIINLLSTGELHCEKWPLFNAYKIKKITNKNKILKLLKDVIDAGIIEIKE